MVCGEHRESRLWGSGLQQCEFAQRSWRGELSSGDRRHRNDNSGDRFKRPAVKSSTMKGSINYEGKSLPVRVQGDGAESRKSVQDRYSELLLSYEEIRTVMNLVHYRFEKVWPVGRRHIPVRIER